MTLPHVVLGILVEIPVGVLPALPGVGLSSQFVHRDGQSRVGFVRDTAEGHGACRRKSDQI